MSGPGEAGDAELARLARARAARQLLHRPRTHHHPADIARAICGAQAQELPAARLHFRARHPSLIAADVERARTEERSLIRLWLMRNTAHLIATDDLPWMRPLFAPLMEAFNRRCLGQLGVDANTQARALSGIGRHLGRHGPLTRSELSERLERSGIPMDPRRRGHIFPLAVSTGLACLGPGDGGSMQLVAAEDWLGTVRDHGREQALAELARRYFAAFGPATEADFAGWAGLSLRDVRAGMTAIASELREAPVAGVAAWQPKGRAPRVAADDLVRLLPAYDTYLMGHRERRFIAPDRSWAEIGPGGGILRPTITLRGTAVGTWRLRRAGRRLEAELLPFGQLPPGVLAAVEGELDDISRFEGAAVSAT